MNSPKYFAIGLQLGISEPKEVQEWINFEINKSNNPPEELINLAFIKEDEVMKLYSSLQKIPDETTTFEIVRELLSEVTDKKLSNINFCRKLAESLYNIWVEHDYNAPEDLNLIGFLDDEYSLSAQGISGTIQEWHNEVITFVKSFRKNC